MKKLFIVFVAVLMLSLTATSALAYMDCNSRFVGGGCYNCHPGAFGHYQPAHYYHSYSYNYHPHSYRSHWGHGHYGHYGHRGGWGLGGWYWT